MIPRHHGDSVSLVRWITHRRDRNCDHEYSYAQCKQHAVQSTGQLDELVILETASVRRDFGI